MPRMTLKQAHEELAVLRNACEQLRIENERLRSQVLSFEDAQRYTTNALRPLAPAFYKRIVAEIARGEFANASAVIAEVTQRFDDNVAKQLRRKLWIAAGGNALRQ